MAQALRLARRGLGATHPNPAVGCVLVRGGVIVGEGFHARAGLPHAEAEALAAAGEAARGATAYVTLEPCAHTGRTPPCADALIAAGVTRVVCAHEDPDPRTAGKGIARLRAAGIEVICGVMQDAARALNRGFVQRLTAGRPAVTLKLAASLDGRTAMASGESQWITSEAARHDVHRQRARHHAVLTSAQTVLDDDPQLNCRLQPAPQRQPQRMVLDARGRVPASAQVWRADGAERRLLTAAHADAATLHDMGVKVDLLPANEGGFDLAAVMRHLAAEGINDILVECGPRLAGALLQAEVVDTLLLYLAPKLLGDSARPLAALPGLDRLEQHVALQWQDVRHLGPDLRLTAIVGLGGT